jgi:tetratricopeptide (TPR) repeat protein
MGLRDAFRHEDEALPELDLSLVYDASIKDLPGDRYDVPDEALNKVGEAAIAPGNTELREIFVFEAARQQEPDYFLPYVWIANIQIEKRNYAYAMDVLREGIVKSKGKCMLCRQLGECYFRTGDLEKAIYWFCTAIMSFDPMDFNAYLFLWYISEAHGLRKASRWFRRRAYAVSRRVMGEIREYNDDYRNDIIVATRKMKTDHTMQMLDTFYWHAKETLGHL